MSERPPELAVEGLTTAFPGKRALDDVSMTVEAGEVHAEADARQRRPVQARGGAA